MKAHSDANDIARTEGSGALRDGLDGSPERKPPNGAGNSASSDDEIAAEQVAASNGGMDEWPFPPVGEPGEGRAKQRPKQPVVFQRLMDFCAAYVPLAYVIEGVARTSSLYGLTGKTSAGKTGFLVAATLAVATGRKDILGVEVTRGRVAYVACENPDDVRMRFKIMAFTLGIDLHEIDDQIIILSNRHAPEDIVVELKKHADRGAPFAFVAVETFAAFFDGKDINDAVQAGEFARRLRPLTQIKGLPCVIVACHPVKNATEEQLIP